MLHRSSPPRLAIILALALALVVGACSTGTQAGAGDAGGDAGGASIGFATPGNGAVVGIPFDVALESSVALGEPGTGNHHAHIYFDTGTDAADYDIVYGNSWQVTRQLAPGEHTLTVALANPDHSLAGPTESITIEVGNPAAGGGSPSPAPSTGVIPGY